MEDDDIRFIVRPTGTSHASAHGRGFCAAHFAAAAHAAASQEMAYVVRSDRGEQRIGFGKDAPAVSTSVLAQINQSGVAAYFDYAHTAWLPLPAEEMTAFDCLAEHMLVRA